MKRMTLLLAAGAAGLLAGCGGPTYPTFGQASYRIEGMAADANGGAPTRTVIYRDGPQMRVEAALPQYGPAVIVFDQSTDAAYVLTQTATTATVAPSAAQITQDETTTTTPNGAPVEPSATGDTATTGATPMAPTSVQPAVGVAVRLDEADAPQPMETVWAALGADNARGAGECEVAGEQGHQWRPREESAGVERVACITDDGIVLRVTENGRALWEATSVQRGEQDPALFGVPPGYQLIDPQRVAEEVGENLEQLDSVTGPAQTAPRG